MSKSRVRSEVNHYRPISVLPVLSKTIESHVHDSLYGYLCEHNLLYSQESDSRNYHSTETALIRTADQLLFSLDNNRVCGLVLIDFRKAIDMVDCEILLTKLQVYGMGGNAMGCFRSYLFDRCQFVFVNGKDSTQMPVPYGVPQASIFEPLLFILYINDLPLYVNSANVDLYADTIIVSSADVNSIAQLPNDLTNSLDDVEKWACANRLPLNESKTKLIFVTGKRLRRKLGSEDQHLNL